MRDKLKFTILGLGLLAVILGLKGFTGNFTFGKSEALIARRIRGTELEAGAISSPEEYGRVKLGNIGLVVTHDPAETSKAAVENLVEGIRYLIEEEGKEWVVIAASHGQTMDDVYYLLREQYTDVRIRKGKYANETIWSRVKVLQTAEFGGQFAAGGRSNRSRLKTDFVVPLGIKEENFLTIDGQAQNPQQEAERYEKEIQQLGGIDILMLGIAPDGHVAQIPPGTPFDRGVSVEKLTPEMREYVARRFGGRIPDYAITMGPKTIKDARHIIVLANGSDKAKIVKRAIMDSPIPELPASVLQYTDKVNYIIDREAAMTDIKDTLKEKLKETILKYLEPFGRVIVYMSDFDYTFKPMGEDLGQDIRDRFTKLTQAIQTAIVTGQDYRRIREGILIKLDPTFNYANFNLLGYGGAAGWGTITPQMVKENKELPLIRELERKLTVPVDKPGSEMQIIKSVIDEFKQSEFGFDFWKMEIMGEYKIRLWLKDDPYRSRQLFESEVKFLQERLPNGLFADSGGEIQVVDFVAQNKVMGAAKLIKKLIKEGKLTLSSTQGKKSVIVYSGDGVISVFGNDESMRRILEELNRDEELKSITGIKDFSQVLAQLVMQVGSSQDYFPDVLASGLRGDWGTAELQQAILEHNQRVGP